MHGLMDSDVGGPDAAPCQQGAACTRDQRQPHVHVNFSFLPYAHVLSHISASTLEVLQSLRGQALMTSIVQLLDRRHLSGYHPIVQVIDFEKLCFKVTF